jgi:hypothetical protein
MIAWFLPLTLAAIAGAWLRRKYRLSNSDLNPRAPVAQTMGDAA